MFILQRWQILPNSCSPNVHFTDSYRVKFFVKDHLKDGCSGSKCSLLGVILLTEVSQAILKAFIRPFYDNLQVAEKLYRNDIRWQMHPILVQKRWQAKVLCCQISPKGCLSFQLLELCCPLKSPTPLSKILSTQRVWQMQQLCNN